MSFLKIEYFAEDKPLRGWPVRSRPIEPDVTVSVCGVAQGLFLRGDVQPLYHHQTVFSYFSFFFFLFTYYIIFDFVFLVVLL